MNETEKFREALLIVADVYASRFPIGVNPLSWFKGVPANHPARRVQTRLNITLRMFTNSDEQRIALAGKVFGRSGLTSTGEITFAEAAAFLDLAYPDNSLILAPDAVFYLEDCLHHD